LEPVKIEKETNSPEVDFDFSANIFRISGMSYMEDAVEFYRDLISQLETHFAELSDAKISFIFDMAYFNSSSSRIVFSLLELLDKTAGAGNEVSIEWHFDDEDIGEEGEILGEDLENAKFKLVEKDL